MDEQTLKYWIGFNRAKGVGPVWLPRLIEHFGSIEAAWNASARALSAVGLSQRTLESLLSVRAHANLDAELRRVIRAGCQVVTLVDPEYPPLLKSIPDAPPLLYVKGTLSAADQFSLAVVGTRRATAYGLQMTRDLLHPLVEAGVTIVSGLARGIDAAAHRTALDAGGRTIAVLANGLDTVYPPEHRDLAEEIAASGALISELPLGEPAEKLHFAPRNRIISGLTLGTLVIEANERSGALLTADCALEQGREVFAVPGNLQSPASKGTNTLIQEGARMVTGPADLLNALVESGLPEAASTPKPVKTRPADVVLEEERTLLGVLAGQPQHVDSLAVLSGLPVHVVSRTLTILELKGLVQQVGILQYSLR